jgi:hypothetical protein
LGGPKAHDEEHVVERVRLRRAKWDWARGAISAAAEPTVMRRITNITTITKVARVEAYIDGREVAIPANWSTIRVPDEAITAGST